MIVDYISHIIKIENEDVEELINKNRKTKEEKQIIFNYITRLSKIMNILLILIIFLQSLNSIMEKNWRI